MDPRTRAPGTGRAGLAARARALGRLGAADLPVGQLIGPTRALLLDALEQPRTTTQLAELLRLTMSTASRHATVLRRAW